MQPFHRNCIYINRTQLKTLVMPERKLSKKRSLYIFCSVAAVSMFSFAYLNLCAENTTMLSEYLGDISYSDFRLEEIVLPDLHFFESSFRRIMEVIFTRV